MESTLVKYGKLSTNTVDGKLPSKEDGGTIYVQHNCLSVLNIHRVPVTVGMKGLMYPYNHVTKYVSKLYLNFRGCFKCVEICETDGSVSCPKYPLITSIHEVMDSFYKYLNIHIPSTKKSNNPPSSTKPLHDVSS